MANFVVVVLDMNSFRSQDQLHGLGSSRVTTWVVEIDVASKVEREKNNKMGVSSTQLCVFACLASFDIAGE